ncbi:unspecified product [Leishmania tarentolae]|uniref:Unspecified product n=1 Tax=Leishmania tarentolae TaxID=5689 RepID=A0A640KJT2_LEITA|nr:unspecified product [Leishmania tarentolae]
MKEVLVCVPDMFWQPAIEAAARTHHSEQRRGQINFSRQSGSVLRGVFHAHVWRQKSPEVSVVRYHAFPLASALEKSSVGLCREFWRTCAAGYQGYRITNEYANFHHVLQSMAHAMVCLWPT